MNPSPCPCCKSSDFTIKIHSRSNMKNTGYDEYCNLECNNCFTRVCVTPFNGGDLFDARNLVISNWNDRVDEILSSKHPTCETCKTAGWDDTGPIECGKGRGIINKDFYCANHEEKK